MIFFLFLLQMVVLYLLSRFLNQSLFMIFYLLTKSQKAAIAGTTFLLFPGTVVHELSHLFVAEILGVRTGKLNLIPQSLEEGHVQAGSVEVAVSDPFRRTIIGLAPIFVGLATITILSYYLSTMFPQAMAATRLPGAIQNPTIYIFTLLGYLLFAISNNMFSSKEDLKGVLPVLIFLGLVIAATYAVGIRINITGQILSALERGTQMVITNLGVVLIVNTMLLVIFRLIIFIFMRSKKRRSLFGI